MIYYCKSCRYWSANPNDNGMGECTGLIASGRIEINAGPYGADEIEIYTPSDHYCEIGQEDANRTTAV
jgi:hypothetical protein